MRFLAVIPMLCMVGSLVLTILSILAGYKTGFMNNFPILTFNTSLLGEGVVSAAANEVLSQLPVSIPTALVSALATRTIDIPPSVTSFIPASLQSAIAEINGSTLLQSVAKELNIHDFYNVHILDFCEGYYTPGPVPNGTFDNPSQNITYCAPPKPFSFFNVTDVLLNELRPGISLSQIEFPEEVQTALEAMAITQKVMFVLYCVGGAIAAIAALQAIIGVLADSRISSGCGIFLDILAFLAIGVASACATAFMTVVVDAVNKYGVQVNIQAYKGVNFLIITWIATLLPLIAALLWCVDCCAGPSNRKKGKRTFSE